MNKPEMPRDPRVSEAFRDLGGKLGEPAGDWQAKVWARIAHEPEKRRARRWLRGWQVATVTLVALVLFVSVGSYRMSQEADNKEKKAQAALAAYQKEVTQFQNAIEALIAAKDKATSDLLAAKTSEEKAAAQKARAEAQKQLAAKRYRLNELRGYSAKREAAARERRKRVNVKCDSNDPLCGL